MKKYLVIMLITLAVIFAVVLYFYKAKLYTNKSDNIKFETSTFTTPISLPEGLYNITIEYPQIISGLDTQSISIFNNIASKSAEAIFYEYKDDYFNDNPKSVKGWMDTGRVLTDLSAGYKIERADNNIVSFIFDYSISSQNLVHPVSYRKTVNYSPHLKKVLLLSDIFKTKSDYLNVISKLTREKLVEGYKSDGLWDDRLEEYFINPGTTSDVENFKGFLVGNDYIIFAFGDYQVGPHSLGLRKVKIMFSEFKSILNKSIL